jgi:hypothetical protein
LFLRCGSQERLKSLSRQCVTCRDPYRDRSPKSFCNRAILQVWLI